MRLRQWATGRLTMISPHDPVSRTAGLAGKSSPNSLKRMGRLWLLACLDRLFRLKVRRRKHRGRVLLVAQNDLMADYVLRVWESLGENAMDGYITRFSASRLAGYQKRARQSDLTWISMSRARLTPWDLIIMVITVLSRSLATFPS